jgi:hypothetical protein
MVNESKKIDPVPRCPLMPFCKKDRALLSFTALRLYYLLKNVKTLYTLLL